MKFSGSERKEVYISKYILCVRSYEKPSREKPSRYSTKSQESSSIREAYGQLSYHPSSQRPWWKQVKLSNSLFISMSTPSLGPVPIHNMSTGNPGRIHMANKYSTIIFQNISSVGIMCMTKSLGLDLEWSALYRNSYVLFSFPVTALLIAYSNQYILEIKGPFIMFLMWKEVSSMGESIY